MHKKISDFQLGKQGISESFIENLKNYFNKNKDAKISVLKSARREGKEGKEDVKNFSEEILKKLGKNFTSKIIGHTISIKKWRKPVRE